jgi:hypothetical protein
MEQVHGLKLNPRAGMGGMKPNPGHTVAIAKLKTRIKGKSRGNGHQSDANIVA